jgi:predicted polyphosphate/ATP-dependent NAD kinase
MKIKVGLIKNPINGYVFVQTKDGTGIGWGETEEEARNHALKQIGEWNKNIEDDEMVLEFVTPTQLMEEKEMEDERYVTSVAKKVYEEELQGMSAKEFFRLLRTWELDELIFPHLNYLEFMDDVKERLVTYYEA